MFSQSSHGEPKAIPHSEDQDVHHSLHAISESGHGGVIAIDLDDVLSETNKEAAQCKDPLERPH
jgi:hypothetical protein